jgi:predicted transcriptional regulator
LSRKSGNKIELKNALITEDNGNLLLIERDEIDQKIEVDKLNIVNELKKFENMNLKFIVKESKPKKEREKKPIFKYKCGCGIVIKSKSEELDIRCNVCGLNFKIVEGTVNN